VPLTCFATPAFPQLDPLFTVTDPTGAPRPGIPFSIGSQSRVTDANGQASFSIANPGVPMVLVLTLVDADGNLQPGLGVTLGGATKTTDANGQATFNIGVLGSVT
jgi:hypothetical protein